MKEYFTDIIPNISNFNKTTPAQNRGFRTITDIRGQKMVTMWLQFIICCIYTLIKFLTHKSLQMTQRYAHLRGKSLKKAADQPEELEKEIAAFVEYYNNNRYHEFLNNLTPADVYYGRDEKIISMREKIKQQTMKLRREYNLKKEGNKKHLHGLNVLLNF
ncbi:IS3 family transposase [candidate division KSB1 bacterium]